MAEPITCKAMVAFGVDDLREEEVCAPPPLPQLVASQLVVTMIVLVRW